MHSTYHTFADSFNKHRNEPNVEIEFRLGNKSNGFFDTNVGEGVFTRLQSSLKKFPQWESVEEKQYEVYSGQGGRRTIIDQEDNRTSEIKTPLAKVDHSEPDLPLDIRMGVSREDPVDENDTSYQVELEIIKPRECDTRDKLYNHIHKIKNLFECL